MQRRDFDAIDNVAQVLKAVRSPHLSRQLHNVLHEIYVDGEFFSYLYASPSQVANVF